MAKQKVEVWLYEVWGNDDCGYHVNNQWRDRTCEVECDSVDWSGRPEVSDRALAELIGIHGEFEVRGDDSLIMFDDPWNGYPLGHVVIVG